MNFAQKDNNMVSKADESIFIKYMRKLFYLSVKYFLFNKYY